MDLKYCFPSTVESDDAKPRDMEGQLYSHRKKSVYKWTYTVQTHVIQGSPVFRAPGTKRRINKRKRGKWEPNFLFYGILTLK